MEQTTLAWAQVWVYACLVVLAGNAKVLLGNRSVAGDTRGALVGLAISGLSLIYGRRIAHASWNELGLSPARKIPRSVRMGVLVVSVLTLLSAIGARALRAVGISVKPLQPPGDLGRNIRRGVAPAVVGVPVVRHRVA
jgi:hypothetical protein